MASYRRHLTITPPIPRSTSTSSRASHVMATTNTPSTTRSDSADTTSRWSSGATEHERKRAQALAKNNVHIVKVGYGERFPRYRRHRHCHDDGRGDRRGDHVEVAAGRAEWDPAPRRPIRRGVRPAGPHRWASTGRVRQPVGPRREPPDGLPAEDGHGAGPAGVGERRVARGGFPAVDGVDRHRDG